MSVSHLASSESHTGTTGSVNQPSFPWDHIPGGTPRGVTVCVWTSGNAGITLATGVTYAGVTVPAVAAAEASRTGSGVGNMKVFHLGTAVPTATPAQVVVSRVNNAVVMWACCITQAAAGDTELYEPGVVLALSALASTEKAVTNGSTSAVSVRYGAGHYGAAPLPIVGPNSTIVESIDIGPVTASVVRETVTGPGSRLVGFDDPATMAKAVVHFAIREIGASATGVTHLAASESHLEFSGSFNEPSFTWEHSPGGTARGVTVFVWTSGSDGATLATGVTYEGVAVPAVEGGEAIRSSGEAGNMKAFHLGSTIPAATPATVVVSRVDSAVVMWACCVTQAAGDDTEVYSPGIVLYTGGADTAEASVHDGNPGENSLRYAGGHFGYSDPPPASANSIALHDFDFGSMTAAIVRELVPGQGARPVGFVNTEFASKAIVHLAVRELVPVVLGDLSVFVYGFQGPLSPIGGLPGLPTLTKVVTPETLHLRDVMPISINRTSPTTVTFQASPDHAAVTNYTAQLYTYPAHTLATGGIGGSLSLGVPTPDASNNITADLAPLFAGKAAGDYTVVIQTTSATGGPIPSEDSNVFTLPVA